MTPEFEKIVTAREAKTLPGNVGIAPLFNGEGLKVKGKRLVSFKAYVSPFRSPEENFLDLKAEENLIQSVFQNYRAPSLAQIKAIVSARKAMARDVYRAGTIAERSLPNASETWFSSLY